MPFKKIYVILDDKDWLYHKYVKEQLSQQEIAGLLGCDAATIRRALRRHCIPRYTSLDIKERKERKKYPELYSRDWLYEQYWGKGKSLGEIGKAFCCSGVHIRYLLLKAGISIKQLSVAQTQYPILKDKKWLYNEYWSEKNSMTDIAKKVGCKGDTVRCRMQELGIPARSLSAAIRQYDWLYDNDWLYNKYVVERKSSIKIAKEIGCDRSMVIRALGLFSIPRKNMLGENNPNWNGGSSFQPYCPKFNERFKESVREKFDRVCFLCQRTEKENGKRLVVHHVNYNKDCLCDDSECEFVPLCVSCHVKTNHNRTHWENEIMKRLKAI